MTRESVCAELFVLKMCFLLRRLWSGEYSPVRYETLRRRAFGLQSLNQRTNGTGCEASSLVEGARLLVRESNRGQFSRWTLTWNWRLCDDRRAVALHWGPWRHRRAYSHPSHGGVVYQRATICITDLELTHSGVMGGDVWVWSLFFWSPGSSLHFCSSDWVTLRWTMLLFLIYVLHFFLSHTEPQRAISLPRLPCQQTLPGYRRRRGEIQPHAVMWVQEVTIPLWVSETHADFNSLHVLASGFLTSFLKELSIGARGLSSSPSRDGPRCSTLFCPKPVRSRVKWRSSLFFWKTIHTDLFSSSSASSRSLFIFSVFFRGFALVASCICYN